MFLAILQINGANIAKVELSSDSFRIGQYIGKQWINFPQPIETAHIIIGDCEKIISEFDLLWHISSHGQPILKNSERDKNYYVWCNLIPRDNNYGLTTGILCFDEANRQDKAEINIPAGWHTKEPSSSRGEASQRDLIKAGKELHHTAINSLDDKSEAF